MRFRKVIMFEVLELGFKFIDFKYILFLLYYIILNVFIIIKSYMICY